MNNYNEERKSYLEAECKRLRALVSILVSEKAELHTKNADLVSENAKLRKIVTEFAEMQSPYQHAKVIQLEAEIKRLEHKLYKTEASVSAAFIALRRKN